MKWLALLLLLVPALSQADDLDMRTGEGTFVKYGLGIPTKDQASNSEVKLFAIGRQSPTPFFFDEKWEIGVWSDVHGAGRKSSGYGSWSLGLEPKLGAFYIHSFWGVALITTKDSMLGSNYQFMQDLGIGLRDYRGVGIGAGYKHISNAGIKSPNKGRDFFYAQIQIPW